jgi:hypothetical protein
MNDATQPSDPAAGTRANGSDPTVPGPESPAPHRPAVTPLRTGTALALVGALLLGVGLVRTTTASVQPECPTGTVLLAKFVVSGNKYDFEEPKGNESVVTIAGTTTSATWTSTQPIAVVLVKGGPGSASTTYSPPQSSGAFSNADLPPVGSDGPPEISNVQFCRSDGSVTSTSVPPTTLPPTTEAPTTTAPTTTAPTTTVPTTTVPTTTAPTTAPTTTEGPTTVPPTTTAGPTTIAPTTTAGPTTIAPTTTAGPTTTGGPTTTTVGTTTEGPTTTGGPTTTPPADVGGDVLVRTEVTPDDGAAVRGTRALAFTGGSSMPLVLLGVLLLLGGATVALVAHQRQRRAGG